MRVVLDNNVIISALIFTSGHTGWIREAWLNREITSIVDKACVEELLRALAYPKFKLSPGDIESLLGEYLPYVTTIVTPQSPGKKIPQCKDPHDQKFLAQAYAGKAKFLVTGDKALLDLHGKTPFQILTPAEFRKQFSGEGGQTSISN